jgi:hypothetical protein
MDHIWLVLQLTKAVETSNFLLYARCLFLMCAKESYGRPIIGLSSPTEKQNYSKRSLSKASSSILRLQWMVAGLANDSGSL